jgi:nucleoside-triphosphatase THEP1
MSEPGDPGRVILLSGPRGAGKTTLLKILVDILIPEGTDVSGILSMPVCENGKKTAIDGMALRSGEIRRLAVLNTGSSGHWSTRQWQFDADAMLWADRELEASTPCDLLVVDELGVLEFERDGGWQEGLKAVDNGHYQTAIVVIRPELIEEAKKRWTSALLIDLAPNNRDAGLEELRKLVVS